VAHRVAGCTGRLRVKLSATKRLRDVIEFAQTNLRLGDYALRLYVDELGYARGWGASSAACVGDLHRLLDRPAELVLSYDFEGESAASPPATRTPAATPRARTATPGRPAAAVSRRATPAQAFPHASPPQHQPPQPQPLPPVEQAHPVAVFGSEFPAPLCMLDDDHLDGHELSLSELLRLDAALDGSSPLDFERLL
jgi:hypothetical protein